jgi:LmbE family N-acetylglucosaminyl deacetylase
VLRRVVGEPRLTRLLQVALRAVYGRYVPEPVKNSLRLQLMLLRRDVEPARATPPTGRIVVLAPHMDDEVFGCGGTIALAADAGARVTFVYVTDGSKGYPGARLEGPLNREAADSEATLVACRKEEARRAAAVLGVSDLVFLDQPDAVLAVTAAAVSALADTLARRAPSAVFLPFLTDLHHDHWITNCLFIEAARRARLGSSVACWGYEVWTPLVANTVVDVTAAADRKRLAMQEFPSQQTEFDYPRAMLGLNTYRSLHRGRARGLAEAFHVTELGVYRRLFETIAVGLRPVTAA